MLQINLFQKKIYLDKKIKKKKKRKESRKMERKNNGSI